MKESIYLSWPDTFDSLLLELEGLGAERISDLAFRLSGAPTCAFYRQYLPNVRVLKGASIKECAEFAFEQCGGINGAWALHSYSGQVRGGERRAKLIEEGFLALLKKRNRTLQREMVPVADIVLQLCCLEGELFVVSLSGAEDSNMVVPVVGGRLDFPEDKRPPSRAYRKLKEALGSMLLEIQPNEVVVDLGASPGSWSFVALEAGAKVTAVDRSELDPALMKNRNLSFITGDAFKFEPSETVDWLLSDIICAPERSIQLLENWLQKSLCNKFCITMKFKGDPDTKAVASMRELLDQKAARYLLRHLENNKNEITAVGIAK